MTHGDSNPSRPTLLLIGGAPGSGKTTLARTLGETLGWPLLSKDFCKELLADALGNPSTGEAPPVAATFVVLYRVAAHLLRAGVSLILESNFHRATSEADLRPLVALARTRYLHCEASPGLSLQRFAERAERGERHWVHRDQDWLAANEKAARSSTWGLYAPLDLGVPRLLVDTSNGYAPGMTAILEFIRQQEQPETADPFLSARSGL